jgi:O-antigen ligase
MAVDTLSLIRTNTPLPTKDHSRPRSWPRWQQTVLFGGFCMLLAFGPLALGVVQYWSVAAFELGASSLFTIWLLSYLAANESSIRISPLFAPTIAYAALVFLQIACHQTADRFASFSEAWLYVTYAILFFLGVQLFEGARIERFARVLSLFGIAYTLFAITQGLTSKGRIFWLIEPRSGSIYGSYVNHNHYAGFTELVFPFVLVWTLDASLSVAKRIQLVFSSVLMSASVFLSGSRGGLISLSAETTVIALLWMHRYGKKRIFPAAVGMAVATGVFLTVIAPPLTADHMFSLRDASRLLIYRDSIRMFLAHPLLGSGLGTFPLVFPHYRVFYDGFFINHAHNDYLEQLLDTGLIGLSFTVWFLALLYRYGLRKALQEEFSRPARIGAAALASCTGFLIHSLTDFNFHIPANAALFFVVCAVATAGSETQLKPSKSEAIQILSDVVGGRAAAKSTCSTGLNDKGRLFQKG